MKHVVQRVVAGAVVVGAIVVGGVVAGCEPEECARTPAAPVRELFVTAPGVEFHVKRGGGDDVGSLDVDDGNGLDIDAVDDAGAHVVLDIKTDALGAAAVPEQVEFTFDVTGDGGGFAESGSFDFETLKKSDVAAAYGVSIAGAVISGTVSYTSTALPDTFTGDCTLQR